MTQNKKIPFVHSNYERRPDDDYQTIDKRCVYGFLEHFPKIVSCVDVCAKNGSGIVDTLKECGYNAKGIGDAFTNDLITDWIVTNPPYKRPLVDQIIIQQMQRLARGQINGFAALLRSNFDFAKSRQPLFVNPYYYGQIKLCFRPWWSEERKAQPIHNYVWHIWTLLFSRNYPYNSVVLYSSGEKP
jgi:hypothetical protein